MSETTLYRYKCNPGRVKKKSGPGPVLTEDVEKKIVNWVLIRSRLGRPASFQELLDKVQDYIIKAKNPNNFINNRPSRHWRESFMKRNPQLSFRKSQCLHTDRADVTQEKLQKQYLDTQEYLASKNLLNIDASRVFNADESNLCLCPGPGKVLAEKGAENIYSVEANSERENFTLLCNYNAAGMQA